jgi:hypothetical protein
MGGALSTDLTTFYGNGNPETTDTSMSMSNYYNQPDPALQGNRQQRRAMAAQKRRKKK